MSLRIAIDNFTYGVESLGLQLQEALPFDRRERLLFDLATTHHLLAVAYLLRDADATAFRDHLVEAGRARQQLLVTARNAGAAPDRFTAASQFVPLLDAFVCGEHTLAAAIVQLTPDTWVEGYEYLDDFRYARVLHALVRSGRPPPEVGRLVDEFEAALDGAETARLPALRALLARDARSFESAMEALVLEWEEQRDAEIAAAITTTERHLTEKYFFVEGLALLRIAEAAGLPPSGPYRYIPTLALPAPVAGAQGSGART